MLELPLTIRLLRPDEIPDNEEIRSLIKRQDTAKIIEGYRVKPNAEHDLPFKFYAEVNINNPKLWDLFIALSKILPENIGTI